jgi:hypothetical protein
VALRHPKQSLYSASYSPDGRWIAFASGMVAGQARLFVAPARNPAPRESEWIPVGNDYGAEPQWSPDGGTLYFRSGRDGYQCIWARGLGPDKRPVGEPAPILHLHTASFGLFLTRPAQFGMAVAKDRLILNLTKTTGALWSLQLEEKK